MEQVALNGWEIVKVAAALYIALWVWRSLR